jgi:hypothetical protein
MKRRSSDPPTRVAALASLFALSFAVAAGCGGSAKPAPPKSAAKAPATRSPTFESRELPGTPEAQSAQRAWCDYLEALYRRATPQTDAWPQRDACLHHTSSATPEMLQRTAACSHQALDGFSGDPFTPAYAAAVRRCGVEVIDALSVPTSELDPYVDTLCERASSCGPSDAIACRAEVGQRYGKKLGRAVGILNEDSRIELRRCLQTAACGDMTEQISGCLEPLLDRLLWTPE